MRNDSDIETLMGEAEAVAEWRGHTLEWDWETNPATVATGICGCGAYVQVNLSPPANGINIGGPAIAVNHPDGSGLRIVTTDVDSGFFGRND